MFDPTVYENLKVVLEGAVYDLDLAGSLKVTAREDLIDLASLSRKYRMAFQLADAGIESAVAEMELSAGLKDLAAEILEQPGADPGCSIVVRFTGIIRQDEDEAQVCGLSEAALHQVWGSRFQVSQTISHEFGSNNRIHLINLQFGRSFTEEIAEDIPRMVDHTVLTLEKLMDR
jgi:hypothetical protein